MAASGGTRTDRPREQERDAWTVLACVDGLGPVGLAALLARYGSGVGILAEVSSTGGVERLAATEHPLRDDGSAHRRPIHQAVAEAIATAAAKAEATLERIRHAGIDVVTVEEQLYPRRLAAIALPPHVLFVRGELAALDAARAVAVVGTRRPTLDGRRLATRIAGAIARTGATVVSGLALGIDGEAHEAALDADAVTIAVIGSGHNRLHPRAHDRLAERIVLSGGAVVSELAPDVTPTPGTFPRRNRVIAGMTDATVVVEAPARSGALITASWALEEGRDAFLVPGPIGERASAGCLSFLRENAGAARIVAGVPQLLDDLGLIDHDNAALSRAGPDAAAELTEVGGTAGRVGRALVGGCSTVDELAALTGLPVATILGALTLLEDRGLVRGVYGRYRPTGPLAIVEPTRIRARQHAG